MSLKDEVEFCLNFLRIQENPAEESCIYSPVSMLNALAMIYTGCDGNTANEVSAVIGKDKEESEIINYYSNFMKRHKGDKDGSITNKDYDKAVISIDETKSTDDNKEIDWSKRGMPKVPTDGTTFKIIPANKLFVDKEVHLLGSFCNVMKDKFDGNLVQVNFKYEKDDAVKTINKFVKEATNKKIEKVFEPKDIRENTAVVLVNAVYFIARWAERFHGLQKGTFYSKTPREIDFMYKTVYCILNYTEGDGWRCVGIPYKENKVWMFIVLPNERDGLHDLINKMDYSMFMQCTKKKITGNFEITMPVFEVSGDFDLKKDFPKLGISDMFDEMKCNLSKMIDNSYHGENCYVYKAVHKAVIKVDEYGTEAAAVSAFGGVLESVPQELIIDHPFMYFIVSANRPQMSFRDKPSENQEEQAPTEILFAGTFC